MTGDRSLRVLNLVANRWWTGSADPALRLTLGLRARGHHALLGLAPGDKFEAKAREAGVEPVEGLHLDVRSGPAAVLADLRRLRRLVREEALDVIHVHHSHDHWLGWWTHGGSALVRSYHNERAVRRGWLPSSLYRSSQALVAISRGVEERLIAAGAPARAVHRVGGVVDTARFAADSRGAAKIREEFHVASAPLIGCVARFAAGRGHETLLEGFRLLRRERPDARLLLVGKGERRGAPPRARPVQPRQPCPSLRRDLRGGPRQQAALRKRSENKVLRSNRWGDPGKQCEAQLKASRANPQSGRRSRSTSWIMSEENGLELNRCGGPGEQCEAQPKASRANPQCDRRPLPPGVQR